MSPVGHLVFKTSEASMRCLVGSTPTSSAILIGNYLIYKGISEQDAENIGLLLSQNKNNLIAACKVQPGLLLDIGGEGRQEASNITPLTAKA